MADDFAERVCRLGWSDLRDLWQRILLGTADEWPSGKAFEYLVLRAFELDGAVVRWPYTVTIGDETAEQIDGAIHIGALSCLVECKDTADRINIEPIAKLRNQLLRRPAGVIGLVFSRSGFTAPALTLAQFVAPQTILLWTGDEVDHLLKKESINTALMKKYRHCVETGTPDYDARTEDLL